MSDDIEKKKQQQLNEFLSRLSVAVFNHLTEEKIASPAGRVTVMPISVHKYRANYYDNSRIVWTKCIICRSRPDSSGKPGFTIPALQ